MQQLVLENGLTEEGHGDAEDWPRQTWGQAHHLRRASIPVVDYT